MNILFNVNPDASDGVSATNAGAAFKSIGIPVDIRINREKEIVSVKGVEKLLTAIQQDSDACTDPQVKQQISGIAGQVFSEEVISTMFGQFFRYYPDRAVRIGDSWDLSLNINSGGINLLNKSKLTFKDIEEDIATLDCTGTVSIQENAMPEIQETNVKFSVEGVSSGTILADVKAGRISSGEIALKMQLEIETGENKALQKIEMTINATVK